MSAATTSESTIIRSSLLRVLAREAAGATFNLVDRLLREQQIHMPN
jgi:hypothetical protein